jgi:hypothetical protein
MHFPGHMRAAFEGWVHEGCPDTATLEEDYKPVEVSAAEFLRRFIECTDVMPYPLCETVATQVGIIDQNMRGMSYGNAANALLVARSSNEEAARDYLLAVFGAEV